MCECVCHVIVCKFMCFWIAQAVLSFMASVFICHQIGGDPRAPSQRYPHGWRHQHAVPIAVATFTLGLFNILGTAQHRQGGEAQWLQCHESLPSQTPNHKQLGPSPTKAFMLQTADHLGFFGSATCWTAKCRDNEAPELWATIYSPGVGRLTDGGLNDDWGPING